MPLLNSIFSQLFPWSDTEKKSINPFDVANLTRGFNGEVSPSIMAHQMSEERPEESPNPWGRHVRTPTPQPVSQWPDTYDFPDATEDIHIPSPPHPQSSSLPGYDRSANDPNWTSRVRNVPSYPNPNADQNRLNQLLYERQFPVDRDHGFKSKLKEVLANFAYGLSQAPQGSSVAQALAMGGAGAGFGLLDKTANERRKIDAEIPRLMQTIQIRDSLNQSRLQQQKQAADILSKNIDNSNDIIMKSPRWEVAMKRGYLTPEDAEYFNQRAKAVIGIDPGLSANDWQKHGLKTINGQTYSYPETGKPVFSPTNAPVDPTEVPQSFDVGNGTPLQLTPKAVAPIFANQAAANANRQLTADTTNVHAQMDADRINAAAWNKYYSDRMELQLKAAQSVPGLVEGSEALQGKINEFNSLRTNADILSAQLEKGGLDEVLIRQRENELNDIHKKMAAVQSDFGTIIGKTRGAEAAFNAIRSIQLKEPQTVKAGKVSAPKVSSKVIPKGKDPLGLFR